MKQNFFYIKVRVELDKEMNTEELTEVAQNLDYTVKSGTEGVKVTDTEIDENALDYHMNKTF